MLPKKGLKPKNYLNFNLKNRLESLKYFKDDKCYTLADAYFPEWQNMSDYLNSYGYFVKFNNNNKIIKANNDENVLGVSYINHEYDIKYYINNINYLNIESSIIKYYYSNIVHCVGDLKKIMNILDLHSVQERKHQDFNRFYNYIPRSNRIGRLVIQNCITSVRDNGKCLVGKKCDCGPYGIAVPGSTHEVIERITNNIIKIKF